MNWDDFKQWGLQLFVAVLMLIAAYRLGEQTADRQYGEILIFIIAHPQVVPRMAADYNQMFSYQEDNDFIYDPFHVKKFGKWERDNQEAQGIVSTGDYGND